MFCVLVYTILTCWLLHRTQSDTNCKLPGRPKSATVSPLWHAGWGRPSSKPQPSLPGVNRWAPGLHRGCENSLSVKCRMQLTPHWTLLNLSSFLTSLIQRSFLDKLSIELNFSIGCLCLLNCSEIPCSDKWWMLLLCTSQNTRTLKSPDVLLPFKTRGFTLPLWNSQCRSQYANANTGDFTKSNISRARLASIANGRRRLPSESRPAQLFSAAAQVRKCGERSPTAVRDGLCQCTPRLQAILEDNS